MSLLSAYLDDLLLIPMLLPVYDLLKGRRSKMWEIITSILIFSLIFELILPLTSSAYTADAADIPAYSAGALIYYYLLR